VAGEFNQWSPDANPLRKNSNGTWSVQLDLQPGFYQYKFVVDGGWIPDPGNPWQINDGADNFNSVVKVGEPPTPKRKRRSEPLPKNTLPTPILTNNPEWIELYYAAWDMAWQKIQHGTAENGFAKSYMDEGFNELIYQWDSCFMTAFAVYAREVFPVMASLDNFYDKQREDGYIQRVYWEKDGSLVNAPTSDEPMVNPPLFAWMEWRYYQITGDSSRIRRVLPVLTSYDEWLTHNCRSDKNRDLYYISMLGSGMDNTPRPDVGKAGWVDFSAQQALAAGCIAKMALATNQTALAALYRQKQKNIHKAINAFLWDRDRLFYFDMTESDTLSKVMHIGAFWTLLSETAPIERQQHLRMQLRNPDTFRRPHMVPTLAYNQPQYDSRGHYWLGSVWAPTNYMVVRGLMANRSFALADTIAANHLQHLADVYFNFEPDENDIAFNERYADGYRTLWECYSPEYVKPATRWDNTFYSRQDFVGWTGLGPIAMLIENIIGLEINGSENTITWRLNRNDPHGLKNFLLKEQKVSLMYHEGVVEVECETPFVLIIEWKGKTISMTMKAGQSKVVLS
jgi:hypothetical protein